MPKSLVGQLVILVALSALVFHACINIGFFLLRPPHQESRPFEIEQLAEFANAYHFMPPDRRDAFVTQFQRLHPELAVQVWSRTSPASGPPSRDDALRMQMMPLLPSGTSLADIDEHRIAIDLPGNATIEAWASREGPKGPPPFGGLLIATLLFIAVSEMLFLVWGVRAIAGPLASFADAADRFTLDGEAGLLPAGGPTEISKASHAFNRMQARIRRMVEDRTQMLAAIGHDLRTPITRLRLRAEYVVDQDLRGSLLRDLDQMDSMVHAALSFLRDQHAQRKMQPLDLASLLQTICDDFTDVGAAVLYDGPDHLLVLAHRDDLHRAFTNLVDNAVAHGRRVMIVLKAASHPNLEVEVTDDGPGLADPEKSLAFEPFRRGGAAPRKPSGFGLGLSIVRAIVEAHAGSIALCDNAAGGLTCRLVLPIALEPPASVPVS